TSCGSLNRTDRWAGPAPTPARPTPSPEVVVGRVVAWRAVRLVVPLFVVTVAAALMIDLLPGDPALHILGADYQTTVEQVEEVRERLGLNDPIHVRYWEWLTGVLQGDLGWSYARRQPASEAIFSALPVTIELAVLAQAMA